MPLLSTQIEDAIAVTNSSDVNSLLYSILTLNVKYNTNEKLIISNVNRLLASAKTRLQGFEILNLLIYNCSPLVISENAMIWINYCIIQYPEDSLREVKLSTIGKIVETAHSQQEFTKKFITNCMSKVLDNCLATLHMKSNEYESSLDTLNICMKYYASWFTPHYAKIQIYLITFLDSTCDKLVEKAALAFHYLQQTGGAGADGANHKQNFSKNFHKICSTTQKLFDSYFKNEQEIYKPNTDDEEYFEFSEAADDSKKNLHVIAKRLKNCLIFLMTMIKTKYPVAKEIKPKILLNVVTRGTTLHNCLCSEKYCSLENYHFTFLLNKIQIKLLQSLSLFIILFQTNALPFAYTISKVLIVCCLNRTQSCDCFKTDCLYQETVYKTINTWLRVSKNSFHHHFQTDLLKCILKDIRPVKTQVTLSIEGDSNKSKSSKAIRKSIQERIISSGEGSHSNEKPTLGKSNEENNCKFALETLKTLLYTTDVNVQQDIIKCLYQCILDVLCSLQTSQICYPYTNVECQIKVYEILVAFCEQDNLKINPLLQVTLEILTRGANNENRFIRDICDKGLSSLEKLCQPICPSLYLNTNAITDPRVINTVLDEDLDESVFEVNDNIKNNLNENLEVSTKSQHDSSRKVNIIDVQVFHTSDSIVTSSLSVEVPNNYVNEGQPQGMAVSEFCEEISLDEEKETYPTDDTVLNSNSEENVGELIEDIAADINGQNNVELDTVNKEEQTNKNILNIEKVDEYMSREENYLHQDNSGIKTSVEIEITTTDEKETTNILEIEKNSEILTTEEIPYQQEDPNVRTSVELDITISKEKTSILMVDQISEKLILKEINVQQENEGIAVRNEDLGNSESDSINENETGEPPTKRAKKDQSEDDDMGDVFEEKCDSATAKVDVDEAFLEDSFVDEVKEY